MEITSAKYTKDALVSDDNIGIEVVSNGKTYYVPLDQQTQTTKNIQEWVAEGNTIEEAD
jgi:hypothetical protein